MGFIYPCISLIMFPLVWHGSFMSVFLIIYDSILTVRHFMMVELVPLIMSRKVQPIVKE